MGDHLQDSNLWRKASVFLSLIFTTLIATTSLCLTTTGWYNTTILFNGLQSRRATIQLIVQLFSALLGALQLYAISSALVFRLNTRLRTTPIALDEIKKLDAFLARKLDLSLPFPSLAISLVYLVVLQIPAALWAGALTPVISSAMVDGVVDIPNYGNGSASYWNNTCYPDFDCGPLVTGDISNSGVITYIPWKSINSHVLLVESHVLTSY